MRKIKDLFIKYRELIVYVICGGLTTVVSFAAQYLAGLVFRGDSFIELRTVISWIVAVVFAFFVNKIFVFGGGKRDGGSGRALVQFGAFVGMRVISLGMEVLIVSLGVRLTPSDSFALAAFGMSVSVSSEFIYKLIAQIAVIISNYFFSKFVIFRKK